MNNKLLRFVRTWELMIRKIQNEGSGKNGDMTHDIFTDNIYTSFPSCTHRCGYTVFTQF